MFKSSGFANSYAPTRARNQKLPFLGGYRIVLELKGTFCGRKYALQLMAPVIIKTPIKRILFKISVKKGE
jgi:hypothetical protein